MFENAIQIAQKFTFPIFYAARYMNNDVNFGQGSLVLLNKEGWFVTANHVFDAYSDFQRNVKDIEQYEKEVQQIEQRQGTGLKQKELLKKKLNYNPKWIKKVAYVFGNGRFGETQAINISQNSDLEKSGK